METIAIFLTAFFAIAQGQMFIPGETLKQGQYRASPGKVFSVGLLDDGRTYNLSIWYHSVKPRTLVWTATMNNQYPFQVSGDARILLEKDGLFLANQTFRQSIWNSSSCKFKGCSIESASLGDNGNLVLTGNKRTLWQSFGSSTDTLLPGQQSFAGVDKVLFSGKFKLRLQKHSVQLEHQDFQAPPPNNIAYWSMTNQKLNLSDPSLTKLPRLVLTEDGVLSFFDANGTVPSDDGNTVRYATDYGTNATRRLKLERNGNLRMYTLSQNNDSWSIVWQAVLTECNIYAACGPFGVCSYRPTPTCTCPPGFHPKVPSDRTAGCDYNTPLICNSEHKFVELVRADFDWNDYTEPVSRSSLEDCKSRCLQDCQCLAAAYKIDGKGSCYLKGGKTGLYNGRQSLDANNIVFFKVQASPFDPATSASNLVVPSAYITDTNATNADNIIRVIQEQSYLAKKIHFSMIALVVGELLVFLIVCTFLCFKSRREKRRMMQKYAIDIEGAPAKFSYKELQTATSNFSDQLGSGAFGTVYKGILPDDRLIAVKKLEGAVQGERQFKAEVSTIGNINHINLVRLLGYCAEGSHRLLVLEYMPTGSLDKVLFSRDGFGFDWNTRFAIALGIARGICYLHEECHECILHCDIKPQNILLDEGFVPKVADFGLARLTRRELALSITTVAGTRGYLAPEWISNFQITAKVDVYSFGMVLLEIISGRDNFAFTPLAIGGNKWHFPPWAYQKYLESDLLNIADPKLADSDVNWEQLERVLKVAFWCIQLDANSRPTMSRVVQMLEHNVEVPRPPAPIAMEGDNSNKLVRVNVSPQTSMQNSQSSSMTLSSSFM